MSSTRCKKASTLSFVAVALLAIPVALPHTAYATGQAYPAKTTAHQRPAEGGTTIDGIAQNAIPASPSVAWVIGLTKRPGWVLSGDPLGLRLSTLYYHAPFGTSHGAQVFQGYGTIADQDLYFSEWLVDGQSESDPGLKVLADYWDAPDHRQPYRQNVQSVTLSIDGATLIGQYFEVPTRVFLNHNTAGEARTLRIIDVDQGPLHDRFSTTTLSQSNFMSVLRRLIGGRTHPDLVAHLQAELNAAPPNTPH